MKQKVFDYIEELERKAKESDKYFKLWHEEKIKNNKAIEYIKKNSYTTYETIDDINYYIVRLDTCDDLLDILKKGDKE